MDKTNEGCFKLDEEKNRLNRMLEILLEADLNVFQKLINNK